MPEIGISKGLDYDFDTADCASTASYVVTVGSTTYQAKYLIGQWVEIGYGKYGKITGIAWQADLPQLRNGYWHGEYQQPGFEYQVQERGDVVDWMSIREEDIQAICDLSLRADLERERLMLLQEISSCPFRYAVAD